MAYGSEQLQQLPRKHTLYCTGYCL